MTESPFHADEQTAQALAGVGGYAAGIRPFMPEQHRAFFGALPVLFLSVPGARGWPIATMLHGEPGFIHAPTPTSLRCDSLPSPSDPAAAGFKVGAPIGLLGLELTTRRRNRANGSITAVDASGFGVGVTQSFGNCAQYIQTRTVNTPRHRTSGGAVETFSGLDANARVLIGASDTFFVASTSRADVGPNGGMDVSHRGGMPGFVCVEGDTLTIPDFRGNRFLNTLGNFLGDNRAGLLFIDFKTGDLLQIAGRVTIDWSPMATRSAVVQRTWRVAVEQCWRRRGAIPFTWTFGDFAPTTLATAAAA